MLVSGRVDVSKLFQWTLNMELPAGLATSRQQGIVDEVLDFLGESTPTLATRTTNWANYNNLSPPVGHELKMVVKRIRESDPPKWPKESG